LPAVLGRIVSFGGRGTPIKKGTRKKTLGKPSLFYVLHSARVYSAHVIFVCVESILDVLYFHAYETRTAEMLRRDRPLRLVLSCSEPLPASSRSTV